MQAKTEIHPFGDFVPTNARYLLLGSFPARQGGDWFYGSKRNQFWQIIERVYGVRLRDKIDKKVLFSKLRIAVADIIYQCGRINDSSLDFNLTNIVYNTKGIGKVLREQKIQKIFFTSRYVETRFRSQFRDIIEQFVGVELVTLPSPSPRYAAMTKEEKILRYKKVLPPIRQLSKS